VLVDTLFSYLAFDRLQGNAAKMTLRCLIWPRSDTLLSIGAEFLKTRFQ
jgi:hypothetical protein